MTESERQPVLTDAEREAIAWAAGLSDTRPSGCRATLRSLLERASKGTAAMPPASAGSQGERGYKWHYGIGPHWIPLTNHDAAPTARASERECTTPAGIGGTQNDAVPAADGEGTRHQEGLRVRASATPTGNTHEPVAWAVSIGSEGLVLDCIFLGKRDADEACGWRNEHTTYGARLIPLYRQPQPGSEGEWQKAALTLGESLAQHGPGGYYEYTPDKWLRWSRERVTGQQPTLTDEEWGAIAYYIGTGGPDKVDATLRKLLERTK